MISHKWELSPKEAIALQKQLASQVDTQTPLDIESVRIVAGVDCSVKNNISRAAIVLMRYPDLTIIETVTAQIPTPFPYITGLLSFREGSVILDAHAKLTHKPDVYLFDGMGIMHPRRLGIAAHIGLWLDAPTIGCGKTHLLGTYNTPAETKGNYEYVIDRGETIGVILRTRNKVKPIYVSIGHKSTLKTATEFVLRCTPKYRLPEPIRAAHNLAGQF